MELSNFSEKFNKVDGKIYVVEEEVELINGVYEGELQHDNVDENTLSVYTGSKLTGNKVYNYTLSKPADLPWKRSIRIYSDAPVVYISYETVGDTVEAEDINILQESIVKTQNAVNEESDRAKNREEEIEHFIFEETNRAIESEKQLNEFIKKEEQRATDAELSLFERVSEETDRAKTEEQANAYAISVETDRAMERENEIATNLSNEAARATSAESTLTTNLNAEITRAKVAESELNTAISNEISRATLAEQDNAGAIATEIARATQRESALESSLNGEISRAKEAEKSNADSLTAHLSNRSNPHAVTKGQVGLANVPNVATNDQTPSYTEASTLTALTNGEKLSIAFGKIAKAVSSLISHLANTSNPHKVTKSQVGLGNVDNTSDTNKPVSTAQQSAIDLAYANSNAYTDKKISDLINGAPTTLDTLGEIADAMAEHDDVVTALNEAIGTKANQTELDTHTENDTIHITSKERMNWNDSNSKKHTHGNQSILDAITQTLIDRWNSAYAHITDAVKHITATERTNWDDANSKKHEHSNKSVLDGITQAMLDKLNGIAAGATKVIVDSSLSSSSTNPVQNKVVKSALDGKAATSHGTHVSYSADAPKANGTASAGSASTVARTDHVHPLQASVTGNSGTTTKWATARNINGMSVQGDADRVNYGTCSTAATTTAKTVACTGFALVTGAEVTVKFAVNNTASSPTLNVNGTGAKPIYYRGAAISAGYLAANRTYTFRYNGTQYELVGDINTNTTYGNATQSSSGLMSASDKKKVDNSVQKGCTWNELKGA